MAKTTKRIILRNVTASYVNVFAPRPKMNAAGPDDVEYSVQVLLPKNHSQLDELKAAITEVASSAFPKLKLAPQGGPVKVPVRDADAEGKAELEGFLFFNARSQYAPGVVDGNKNELKSDADFYSGCRMNVSVTLYPYDTAGSKGVGVALNNIQRVAFGKRLDGRKQAQDEFGEVEEDFSEVENPTAEEPAAAAPTPAKGKKGAAAPSVSW